MNTETKLLDIEIVVDNAECLMKARYKDNELECNDEISYVLTNEELQNMDYINSIEEFLLNKLIDNITNTKYKQQLLREERVN